MILEQTPPQCKLIRLQTRNGQKSKSEEVTQTGTYWQRTGSINQPASTVFVHAPLFLGTASVALRVSGGHDDGKEKDSSAR